MLSFPQCINYFPLLSLNFLIFFSFLCEHYATPKKPCKEKKKKRKKAGPHLLLVFHTLFGSLLMLTLQQHTHRHTLRWKARPTKVINKSFLGNLETLTTLSACGGVGVTIFNFNSSFWDHVFAFSLFLSLFLLFLIFRLTARKSFCYFHRLCFS